MKLSNSLIRPIFWRTFLDVVSRGVFFVINIIIARSLLVSDYGIFSYAISLSQVFYIFTDMGVHLLLIKELGEKRLETKSHWVPFLQLKIGLLIISAFLFLLTLPMVWHWENAWLGFLALLWMLSNSFLDFFQFVTNGLGRLGLATKILFLQRSIVLIGVLLPIIYLPNLKNVLLGGAISSVLGSLISLRIILREDTNSDLFKINFPYLKSLLIKALPVGIGGAFGAWYLRVGVIVLGWVSSSRIIGEYSAAFRIFEITYIFPAAVMSIGVPHLSEALINGQQALLQEVKRILKIMIPVGMMWALFLYYFRNIIINHLYGAEFQGAIPLVAVFALTSFLVFINYVITHLMLVINKQRRHAVHQSIVFIICCLLSVILVPAYQAMGAALAILTTEGSLFLVTLFYLSHHLNLIKD